ncbi:hypothetical protein ABZP36_002829 [Zizania latifolia]
MAEMQDNFARTMAALSRSGSSSGPSSTSPGIMTSGCAARTAPTVDQGGDPGDRGWADLRDSSGRGQEEGQISSCPVTINNSTRQTTILNLNHVPTKASWDLAVTKALQMIKGKQRELVKIVLARCSTYITDTCIDPVELLACLKVEGQIAYQFCIQPPDGPAFVGNSPEQLFHQKYLNVSSEALAGARARGKTRADDFQIGQDLLLSSKEDNEFTIVRDNIKKKLETS